MKKPRYYAILRQYLDERGQTESLDIEVPRLVEEHRVHLERLQVLDVEVPKLVAEVPRKLVRAEHQGLRVGGLVGLLVGVIVSTLIVAAL